MLVTASGSEEIKVNDYVAVIDYDGSPVGADSVLIETAEMALVNGKTYVLQFNANGAARDFYVQVTDGTTPIMSEKLTLGGWSTHTFEFTYNSDSPAKIQLLLGDGTADSRIQLDDFVLGSIELIDDENFVKTDIAEADFAGGDWVTYKHLWDGSTIDASFSQNGNNELVVDVKDVSYADWHALLEQGGYNLVVGKTYRVTFDAKSTVVRDINVELNGVRHDSDAVTDGNQGINLTTEFVTYTVDFVYGGTEDKSDAMLKIFFGKISDSSVPAVITLDNIMVEEFDGTAVVASTNQTLNGTFDEFYTDGYFAGGASFDVEWEEAVVRYADGPANNPWETAFGIDGLTWEPGETYLVEFSAKADEVRDVKLNLWDGGSNQEITVFEVGQTFNKYRVVFTYGIGADSKMEFHLGKGITDNFAGSVFYVDNVTVSKLTEETPAS
jgi:hypothetical protein